jgi:Tfp pilus assembly protein FimV
MREPALEFIIDVRWRDGNLQRTYSLLLEPK